MKSLQQLLEGILDADYDVEPEVLTMRQAGYKCTQYTSSKAYDTQIDMYGVRKTSGIERAGIDVSPYKDIDWSDYTTIKNFKNNKVPKVAWLIRCLLDYCHPTERDLREKIGTLTYGEFDHNIRITKDTVKIEVSDVTPAGVPVKVKMIFKRS